MTLCHRRISRVQERISIVSLSNKTLLTIVEKTGRIPLASLAILSEFESVQLKAMFTTGEEEALFLDEAVIFDRGRSVGILCEVVLVLAGGLSSSGTGNIDTFPEAERVAKRTFPD